MPRRIRNPGSGKAPVNTPGKGEGWGGAAKGAGRGGPAKAFTKDSPTRVTVQAVAGQTGSGAQMGDPEKAARRRELAALEEVRQQQMRDVIEERDRIELGDEAAERISAELPEQPDEPEILEVSNDDESPKTPEPKTTPKARAPRSSAAKTTATKTTTRKPRAPKAAATK